MITQNTNSINQAVEANRIKRDQSKRLQAKNEKYFVKVKDDKGKEYEIRYYF